MTRAEDALYAAELGAAYVGVIFAGGPRNLTIAQAEGVLRDVPRHVQRVGVVTADVEAAIDVAEALDLDVLQFASTPQRGLDDVADRELWTTLHVVDGMLPM